MDNFSIHGDENPPTNPLKEIKFDLVHNIIRYKSAPSLKHLALIRVAISLWQQEDIRYGIIDFFQVESKNLCSISIQVLMEIALPCWRKIEQKVSEKVPQLVLPETLKGSFGSVIEVVGNQLLEFFLFEGKHDSLTCEHRNIYLENLCWTFQGTIDKTNTALRLIKHPGFSTREKYILACNYCLVDEIRSLVQEIPIDIGYDFDKIYFLPCYWFFHYRGNCPEVLKAGSSRLKPLGRNDLAMLFYRVLMENNGVAFQYIWAMANQELKGHVLSYLKFAVKEKSSDIVCFLMSHLNQSEEAKISKMFDIFEMLLKSERWSFVFIPLAKYVCHTIWNFDGRFYKLRSFCKEIGSKDKRYKNIDAELVEYFKFHLTGYPNKRHKDA